MLRYFVGQIRIAAIAFAMVAAIGIAPLPACGVKGPLKAPPDPAAARAPEATTSPAAAASDAPAPEPPERKP